MRVRRVPTDLVALIAITVVIFASRASYLRCSMAFNDPSWFFHFGHRVLEGDVPYRDFVFQVGPLPLYVDAAFQRVFGEYYMASVYASVVITIVRVQLVFMIARRVSGVWAAVPLAIFCAFDPVFSVAHHWSIAYAELFLTASGLFFVLAQRATGRCELAYLAFAGACAALLVTARQSGAVVTGVVLAIATAVMFVRGTYFTRRRLVTFWSGYAAALLLFVLALAFVGALGPAIQQMFLDAPAKKSAGGLDSVLDALTGGAVFDWLHSPWGGFLVFLGMPCLLVGGLLYVAARADTEVSLGTAAMLAIPFALVVGLLGRYGSPGATADIPRVLLSTLVLLVLVAPTQLERWFGLSPVLVLALGALPLASDWALEMSAFGRGWGDASSTTVGVVLLALASTRAPLRAKAGVTTVLAVAALVHVAVVIRATDNPFVKYESAPGIMNQYRSPPRLHGRHHPMLRGLRMTHARTRILAWLAGRVAPGSTCFIYGNVPVLYDLLHCNNPTKLDTTAADFMTAADAEAALAILRAHPPEYLIAQEHQWMSPPLETVVERYDGLNPAASRAMHVGLRALLDEYESVGIASEVLKPELVEQSKLFWDALASTRIYRRKR